MNFEDDELKKIKASHRGVEDAIQLHLNDLGIHGLVTGWTLSIALASNDEAGDEIDSLYTTQSEGLSRWSHIGMLISSLDSIKDYGEQDSY